MGGNSSITTYFKPLPKSTQSSQAGPQTPEADNHSPVLELRSPEPVSLPEPALARSPSSQLPLFSSYSESSPPPLRKPLGRDAVIGASDDEEDDSDSELPLLSAIFAPAKRTSPTPMPSRQADNPCVTPKAKRTALEFHSTPLTIRHRFDMNALLSHVRKDDAADANTTMFNEMLAEEKTPSKGVNKTDMYPSTRLQDDLLKALPDKDSDDNDIDHDRIIRAVKRTEATASRKRWYFFERENDSVQVTRNPFPAQAATGVWKFLARPDTSQTDLGRGLASTILGKGHDLPDEIFLWVLDEVCLMQPRRLSEEYIRLLSLCRGQVHRYLDEDRVHRLFQYLGATAEANDPSSKLVGVPELDDPYPGPNDWRCLCTVLRLLSWVASELSITSVACVVRILLRLGIDPLVHENIDVCGEYTDAMESLVSTVPPNDWDNFCDNITRSLLYSVGEATLWWCAVSSIPTNTARCIEFRRRLALVFFFDDPPRACQHPEDSSSVRAAIERLEAAEFIAGRETDYHELAARIYLLDVAVDDGSPPAQFPSAEAERQFNADVDELTRRIKTLEQSVPQSGAAYSSRLETKAVLGAVRSRLPYAVRSRRPPKNDIYGRSSNVDDPFKPRQQAFMQRFLKKGTDEPIGSEDVKGDLDG